MRKIIVLCFILYLCCFMNLIVQAQKYSADINKKSVVTIAIIDKSDDLTGDSSKHYEDNLLPNFPRQDIPSEDLFPQTGQNEGPFFLGLVCMLVSCLIFFYKKQQMKKFKTEFTRIGDKLWENTVC